MEREEKDSPKLDKRRKRAPRPEERKAVDALPLWHETVQGGKLVKMLVRTVEKFRAEDAAEHGNRQLFLDDVFLAYLLAFFNPSIRTLRTFEDFSQTQQAQRHLTTARICRSTLSDFHKFVDPQRLAPLITELRGQLTRKYPRSQRPPDLAGVLEQVIAVDGTFFNAAADVAWAIGKRNQHTTRYRARADVHLNISSWIPEVVALPEPGEGEAHRAMATVTAGAIHLYDRGFGSFELIAAHYQERENPEKEPNIKAHYVLRAKTNQLLLQATEEQELTPEQIARGIVSDRSGYFAGSQGNAAPRVRVREIVLRTPQGEELRLLTNLLDVQAEIVGDLYRLRWQIELFFRWLKCYAHFDHLITHNRQGVLLNFYVVVIGVLLMYLHTGGRPSKYALVMLGMVARGGGDLESILPILRERERQCEVARQSAAKRRARKQAESR